MHGSGARFLVPSFYQRTCTSSCNSCNSTEDLEANDDIGKRSFSDPALRANDLQATALEHLLSNSEIWGSSEGPSAAHMAFDSFELHAERNTIRAQIVAQLCASQVAFESCLGLLCIYTTMHVSIHSHRAYASQIYNFTNTTY